MSAIAISSAAPAHGYQPTSCTAGPHGIAPNADDIAISRKRNSLPRLLSSASFGATSAVQLESYPPLTIVIKLGASNICDEVTHFPQLSNLSALAETIVKLRAMKHRVILVSSGAVGHFKRAKSDTSKIPAGPRAMAAIGQGRLMSLYDDIFNQFDVPIAQILLTRNDLREKGQYSNAVNTFNALLDFSVVPIVNENDPVVDDRDRQFGENDTLSAVTAGMVGADYLCILTDVDCLYTDNPRTHADAEPVTVVDDIAKAAESVVSSDEPGSSLGIGGMAAKLIAADFAAAAGVETLISNGANPTQLLSILASHRPESFPCCEPASEHGSQPSESDSGSNAQSTVGSETAYGQVPLHTHVLVTASNTDPQEPNTHQPHMDQEYWTSKGLDDIVGLVLETASELSSDGAASSNGLQSPSAYDTPGVKNTDAEGYVADRDKRSRLLPTT